MKRRNRNSKRQGRRRGQSNNTSNGNSSWHDIKMPLPIYIPAIRTMRYVFGGSSILGSDAFGLIKAVIPFDPTATLSATYLSGAVLFDEYAGVRVNWAEIKIRRFEIQIYSALNANDEKATPNPLAISSVTGAQSVLPTSYNSVMDNADSQMYPLMFDNSAGGKFHAVRMTVGTYATTLTPNPGSSNGISAGCPGFIQLYGDQYPTSSRVGFIRYRGEYIFRNRV